MSTVASTARPWLSILIPVYNVEPYLLECIDSITCQSDHSIEIIALEDCSTDDSKRALQEIAAQSSVPVNILYHDQNRGLSSARNTMLAAARGRYFWFFDSDDVMELGAIDRLKCIVESYAPELVLCDFRVLRVKQLRKHRARGENHKSTFVGKPNTLLDDKESLFYGLYKKGELHIWSKITHRKLWDSGLRFPDGKYMEDMMTTPRIALNAKTYYYEPSVWVAYRQREGSILSTQSLKKIDDTAIGSKHVLGLWLAKCPGLSDKSRLAFSHYCARTHYVVMRDLKRFYPKEYDSQKESYRQKFIDNIHWGKSELGWQYAKNGLITRLIRFLLKF